MTPEEGSVVAHRASVLWKIEFAILANEMKWFIQLEDVGCGDGANPEVEVLASLGMRPIWEPQEPGTPCGYSGMGRTITPHHFERSSGE
jgi:hypothetical protein